MEACEEITLNLDPELYKKIALAASLEDIPIEQFIVQTVERAARTTIKEKAKGPWCLTVEEGGVITLPVEVLVILDLQAGDSVEFIGVNEGFVLRKYMSQYSIQGKCDER